MYLVLDQTAMTDITNKKSILRYISVGNIGDLREKSTIKGGAIDVENR